MGWKQLPWANRPITIIIVKTHSGIAQVIGDNVFMVPGTAIFNCPSFGMVDGIDGAVGVFDAGSCSFALMQKNQKIKTK